MAQSAWFREDFAATTLEELSSSISSGDRADGTGASASEGFGVPLADGADRAGVWLETGDLVSRDLQAVINVWARLANSRGLYRNLPLGEFGGPSDEAPDGWRFFASDLPDRVTQSEYDWYLAAVFLTTSSFVKVTAGRVYVDDFTVFGEGLPEEGTIAEGFEAQGQWAPLGTGSGAPDRLEASASAAHSGEGGLAFSWTETFGGELRGIHLSPVPLPLPAIGGAGLQAGELLRIEQGRASIPVQVMAVTDLFPTVTDFRRPFLLLDVENYLTYLRLLPPGSLKTNPEEIWLSLSPGHDREAVIERIRDELPPYVSVTDRQEAAAQAAANPLAGGGWDGLTGFSMAGIGLVVVTVLLMHSVASVRAGSVDTAVARALGMSNRQLLMSLAAERWLMAGAAIAAGAAIGYWPGLELVQLLDVSLNRGSAVPPMIPEVHGLLLASVLAGLVLAVLASVALGALLAWRLSPVQVLREGA